MEPLSHDGPSVERSVLRRLNTLDPLFRITWSKYALDPETGQPILGSGRLDPYTGEYVRPDPILDPCFYLWRKDSGSSHHFFVEAFPEFGYREIRQLESDLVRFMGPEEISRFVRTRAERLRQRALDQMQDRQIQKMKANKSRIRDLVFEGKAGVREAKSFSYSGQTVRRSSAEGGLIEQDAREAGWELDD